MASAADAGPFVGLGGWGWPTAEQAPQLGASGLRAVRAPLAWDWVEHERGNLRWDGVDGLMRDAATAGYDLVLVVNGCAAWACGGTRMPPLGEPAASAFQQFVGAAVQRYGAGGQFWAEHPELRPTGVSWQVWNEVNVGADWPYPTADGYNTLLQTTASTIKAVDPSARVVSAGLAELPAVASGASLISFLASLEADPRFRSGADVVAVHGYSSSVAGLVGILDQARAIMAAAGDARPIWVTEFGWASAGPADAFTVSPDEQAARLSASFATMMACRARWGLERAYWFGLRDVSSVQLGEPDFWGMNTGLYGVDGTAKPARQAFDQILSPGNAAPTDCRLPAVQSVRPLPTVTITKAPTLVGRAKRYSVTFQTSDPAARTECSLSGAAWRPCSSPVRLSRPRVEGKANVVVRAIRPSDSTPGPTSRAAWLVDLTPPTTRVVKRPPRRSSKQAATLRFDVRRGDRSLRRRRGERVTFRCRLDGQSWRRCSAVHRIRLRRSGVHTLRVRAVDGAGNLDRRGVGVRFTVLPAR